MTDDGIWINSLKDEICELDDKVLFEEAANCFLGGQLRAAYIMTWLAIVESLKRKLSILSDMGDKNAIESVKKIDQSENSKHSTDKIIIEESNKCGVLDKIDFGKTMFLYEQRCLFAHPYNLNPDIDEVKFIIGQAARITLCKELYYNKFYLDELILNIKNKPFFLPSDVIQIRKYAQNIVSRTPENLHPYFFKSLLSKIGEVCKEEGKFQTLIKLRYFIIELLVNSTLQLEDKAWTFEKKIIDYPYESFIGLVHPDTWLLLPERFKEMLFAYLEIEVESSKSVNLRSIASILIQNKSFEHLFVERYLIYLNSLSFSESISFYGNTDATFDRVCLELESFQFEKQNFVIDFLKNEKVILSINQIEIHKQIRLGKLLKQAAANNHWKSKALITSIVNKNIILSDGVLAGIALGNLIQSLNELDIDEKLKEFVLIINEVPESIQNILYDIIDLAIDEGRISNWFKITYEKVNFMELIKGTEQSIKLWNLNNKDRFDKIIEKIIKYMMNEQPDNIK